MLSLEPHTVVFLQVHRDGDTPCVSSLSVGIESPISSENGCGLKCFCTVRSSTPGSVVISIDN